MSLLLHDFGTDIMAVQQVDAIPKILDVVCRTTGMGFAAVARVTDSRWVCCAVRDDIAFGLLPGGELKLETTLCHEIRQSQQAVIIENVADDSDYRGHHTPAMYGFQSYISVPIFLGNGDFFGTLCAIDPKPARLKTPEIISMFKLFSELIALNLDAAMDLASSEASLAEQRTTADLRGQFNTLLAYDLRQSLETIRDGVRMLKNADLDDGESLSLRMMQDSAAKMERLVDSVLGFAQAKVGTARSEPALSSVVQYALLLAVKEDSDLTARLLRMVLLNESERHGPPHGLVPS